MWTMIAGLLFAIPAPTPVVTYQADCDGLTITSSGYPHGAWGLFSIGDEPPRELVLNTSGFTAWPGDLDGDHYFTIMAIPGDRNHYWADHIQCEPTIFAEPETPVQIGEPAPDPAAQQPTLDLSPWVDVVLAPPW